MKIAIVGAGISGLVSAYLLNRKHEITVFEAGDYAGGHTHTHRLDTDEGTHHVDSGFIVFNEKNYPNFTKLLRVLGVESQDTAMSFSVRCEQTGLEYNGTSLNRLFAQRRNLLRPRFYRMIRDILRFGREAPAVLENGAARSTLGEYLDRHDYSREFQDHYIVPMGSALWSAPPRTIRRFPMETLVSFFQNHGMLQVNGRPQWKVIRGGSQRYVERLTRGFEDRIRLQSPVRSIRRSADHVDVRLPDGSESRFDHVVVATHSDQALRMLDDPTSAESDVLGSIPYQPNDVALHTDASVLPRRRRAWAAWNYHIPREERDRVFTTYNMNILQSLRARREYCVTLNDRGVVADSEVLRRMNYAHPVYVPETVEAQSRHDEISGGRTHYCGAYWGYGFHEDGVQSALRVAESFGESLTLGESQRVGASP